MSLSTRLQEIEARLRAATPVNLKNLPDHAMGLKIVVVPTRGFELSVDVPIENAQFYDRAPTDLALLLRLVKLYGEALGKVLHEGNLAAQGHWDATDKMKTTAYDALTEAEKIASENA